MLFAFERLLCAKSGRLMGFTESKGTDKTVERSWKNGAGFCVEIES
jgi:hypothetical protein